MRRVTLTFGMAILAACGAAVPAGAQAVSLPRPVLGAKLAACTTGAEPAARAATFTAAMPARPRGGRLAMRFELQQALGAKRFSRVDVPGWDSWERSRSRTGFVFTKRVQDLAAPASYRAVVRFRWLDRRGRLMRSASRTTAVCRQPDPRAQLMLERVKPVDGDESLYEIVVRNNGGKAAQQFRVVLTVNGVEHTAQGGPLASGSRERIRIRAQRCEPGSTVLVAIDPDGAVDEGRESDNVVRRPCALRN